MPWLLFGAAAGRANAEKAPPATRLSQDAYVWQRVWTPHLRQSVMENAREFSEIDVLVAELSEAKGEPVAAYSEPDWAALVATGRRIGIVVRSGNSPIAAGAGETKAASFLLDTCANALARARGSGVEPVELQLDLDAATSQLAAYRPLLRRLRARVRPVALVLTVLPDWLRSPGFVPLASEADSYVLQVHSLERPRVFGQAFTLCDPVRAERWIGEASAIGIAFRVALPTYGYRVAFGPDNRFMGLQAEGPRRAWPYASRVRTEMADPGSMAGLVHAMADGLPRACKGIVWFRMPSEDDQLAWHWITLRKVMRGEIPLGHVMLVVPKAVDGATDLAVVNDGEAQVALSPVVVTWKGAALLAADGISGWRIERTSPGALTFVPPSGDAAPLFPGERRQMGWMRLEGPAQIRGASLPFGSLRSDPILK